MLEARKEGIRYTILITIKPHQNEIIQRRQKVRQNQTPQKAKPRTENRQ